MGAVLNWLKRSSGLNNKIDPSRLEYDEKLGVVDLAEAVNVRMDASGAISRRLGFTATSVTSSCHSLFYGGGECVGVSGSALVLIGEDGSLRAVRNVTAGARMSYTQVGDAIFYMNGSEKGIIRDGASWEYDVPSDVKAHDSTRVFSSPPIGSIVRYFAGRIWIAQGKVLWYSEPFGPNVFRRSTGFIPFPSEIKMIAPVRDGIFVGTSSNIIFLGGTNPKEMTFTSVMTAVAVTGTDVEVDGFTLMGGKISPFLMQVFTTDKGICAGTVDGQLFNLTFDRLTYPKGSNGTCLYNGEEYVVSLSSEESGERLTICLNLRTGAVSQWTGYNFRSMVKFGKSLLGGNDSGLWKLEDGDLDNSTAIRAWFKLATTDFGLEYEKRLRRLYVSYRTDGSMKLTVTSDNDKEVELDMPPNQSPLTITHKSVAGGRDIRGKFLDLKVENIQGSDFTINEIKAVLIILGYKAKEGL